MEPTKALMDELYREQVERARAMSPEERVLEGLRLFDRSCRVMRDGIRNEFPGADAATVERILAERLALARRLENRR